MEEDSITDPSNTRTFTNFFEKKKPNFTRAVTRATASFIN